MLDAVSTGLHPSAVITQLAEKYGVIERALWSDWQRREKWVPVLLNLEKYTEFTEMIEQKLNAENKALTSKIASLESTIGAMQETDKQFKAALSKLAIVSTVTEP